MSARLGPRKKSGKGKERKSRQVRGREGNRNKRGATEDLVHRITVTATRAADVRWPGRLREK